MMGPTRKLETHR